MRRVIKKRVEVIIFGLVILLILILGANNLFHVLVEMRNKERMSIGNRANTVASYVDNLSLLPLETKESDLEKNEYKNLKNNLVKIRTANPDIRFVYIVKKINDKIVFMVDSEPSDSPDYSPPGQIYEEATLEFFDVFENGKAIGVGPTEDRWGRWISGLAPIKGELGEVVAVLGLDVDSKTHEHETNVAVVATALLTITILSAVLGFYYYRKKEEELFELKEEFLSIASHELRAPMTAIKWSTDEIIKKANNEEIIKRGGQISLSINNLLGVVNNMIENTALEVKDEIMQKTRFKLKEIIDNIVNSLNILIQEKNIKLSLIGVNDDLEVFADKNKFQIVISNFLTNAIKYTDNNKNVTLTIKDDERYNIIEIKDEGIGIPKEDIERIFSGFHRAKNTAGNKIGGSGLGLFVAKKIMELHKGKIICESELGVGSTFKICLLKQ